MASAMQLPPTPIQTRYILPLEPDGKHIIDGRTLKHIKGKLVIAKHITALNRLATLLNESPGHDNDVSSHLRHRNANPLLDRKLRQIHPHNMHITALSTNDLPDATLFPAPHQDQRLITEYLQRGQEATFMRQTPPLNPKGKTKTPDLRDQGTKRVASKQRNHTHTMHKDKAQKRDSLFRVGVTPAQTCHPCPCKDHKHKEYQAKHIFEQNKHHKSEQLRAATVTETMYGHTNQIDTIKGWRMVTERNTKRSSQGRQLEKIKEIQYQVQWTPTIIDKWAMPYFEMAGYSAKSYTPYYRHESMGKDLPALEWACISSCEICWSPHSREYDEDEDCHETCWPAQLATSTTMQNASASVDGDQIRPWICGTVPRA